MDKFESLKLTELKELARQHSLPISGTKADLIKRLSDSNVTQSSAMATSSPSKSDVPKTVSSTSELTPYLFVPNLIGYGRIILAGAFAYFAHHHQWHWAGISYFMSQFLDAFDGYAARALNQATMFGAVLDMVSDRCTTTVISMVLAHLYPDYLNYLIALVVVDFGSHWIHMYTSLQLGSTSHKSISTDKPYLLRLYYGSRPLMFLAVLANEGVFCMAYVMYYVQTPVISMFGFDYSIYHWLFIIAVPLFIFKQSMNILQMIVACNDLVGLDISRRQQEASKSH